MNPHWNASCRCNRLLRGQRHQPVCARVYALPPSLPRSAFLILCDLWFGEYQHCARIHRVWANRAQALHRTI